MKTAAFIISRKENEKRRALIPADILTLPKDVLGHIFIEEGYGEVLGYNDDDYARLGINVVGRNEALEKDILIDPKIGDAEYLNSLHDNQIIFGWVHAVQNKYITDQIIAAKATAIVWEDMYIGGRHTFWRNNEIAGEAAIMHAYSLYGVFPYETKVALLGNGNVARGAYRILVSLGANVTTYNRRSECLFREEMCNYDVIVNAILWDTSRKDHIIYKKDLQRLKPGCLIIDISCDRAGGIETSIPTTLNNPTYIIDGITHYVVDHTPSIFYRTVSNELSAIVCRTLPLIMSDNLNKELLDAMSIEHGIIRDKRIIDFQNREA